MTAGLAGNLYFKDFDYDTQLLRTLGHIYDKGADFGEVMTTAFTIESGDKDSWHQGWQQTAARLEKLGHESLAGGHIVSGRRALFRACEYYRASEYFLRDDLTDERVKTTALKVHDCFATAVKNIYPEAIHLTIDFEGAKLPAYFLQANDEPEKLPTYIFVGGYDTFAEEAFFFGGRAALARGVNILLFDGPGQGRVLREQGVPLTPDWDKVIGAVIDELVKQPKVDADKIAIIGRNFGGYLAARAASGEERIAALVLDPGQHDMGDSILKQLPEEVGELLDAGKDDELDQKLEQHFAKDSHLRFFFLSRMGAHGINKPSQYLRELEHYRLGERIKDIKCHTAVCATSEDNVAFEQSKLLHDKLNVDKLFVNFSAEEGAGERTELGAPALFYLKVYDWLEDIFK